MAPRTPLAVIASLAIIACADIPTTTSPAAIQQARNGGLPTEQLLGLTSDNSLVAFTSTRPNQVGASVRITGLEAGERVLGLDFRPSDLNGDGDDDTGTLYVITDADRLYIVDPETGAASSPVALATGTSGVATGMGFNPVPDRLRIHTDAGQNLRINVDNGAVIVDGALQYGALDVNAGASPRIAATGYTNNDNDPATGTALFALDVATQALVTFPAATGGPNGGVMATVGTLGVSFGSAAGFDISVASGLAYAVLDNSSSGKATLHAVDLATGSATPLGLLAQLPGSLMGIVVRP